MNAVAEGPEQPLAPEIDGAIAELARARRAIHDDDFPILDGLWQHLERITARLAEVGLDHQPRELRLSLLALIDELERTLEVFRTEHAALRDQLSLASRNLAAGAAYLRARGH